MSKLNGLNSVALIFLLFFGNINFLHSQSLDCRKSASINEKLICSYPELIRLDNVLNSQYTQVIKRFSSANQNKIRVFQKKWLADRDEKCDGSKDCLVEKYNEQIYVFYSLLVRLSDDASTDYLSNPVVMSGKWFVDAQGDNNTDGKIITAINLPPKGGVLLATPGKLCITDASKIETCSVFALTTIGYNAKGASPKVSGTLRFLTYFDGRADFEVILKEGNQLEAIYRACQPDATQCQKLSQKWLPESAHSFVKEYKIFNSQ